MKKKHPFPNALSVVFSSVYRTRRTTAGNKDLNFVEVNRLKQSSLVPELHMAAFFVAFGLTKPLFFLNMMFLRNREVDNMVLRKLHQLSG